MADFYAPQAIWGRELRHYRKAAGLTQGQLSEKVHFSESLISGVETGQLPASSAFAKRCDEILDTGGALNRLLDWRKAQVFPSYFGRWHEIEQVAVALRTYEPLVVPGLLQTERYAHAMLRGNDAAVAARVERQAILTRERPSAPTLRCILDEAVLYRPVGTAEVMREQLQRLLEVVNPRLSLQLVPHGVHPGLLGAFVIATMKDGDDVLYVDTAVRGITTGECEDVWAGTEHFEAIRTEALPMSMSLDLIKKAMEERWT
ncbi:helix-turn-helix domain-containing protein [Nonomuraea sp. PA05]|uniref:helix-turn-helix domain-containing protein n=1 Tax=Nonomuraea sp. PA05 TaxID=2604466 RepID=UPI0011D46F2D|nr:helix-turn-helix transcriptional regulator [Nonomuraea sp. PA05]TYB58546.1 helix-turn-helix domain-containing protein [Nonomuraea sp. PA05]